MANLNYTDTFGNTTPNDLPNIPTTTVAPSTNTYLDGLAKISAQGADWFKNLYGTQGTFDPKTMTWTGSTGLGGAQGIKDLTGGLASVYGMYNDFQTNKRAQDALNMYKQDRASQYKSNADWNKNIAASGLGTASRPML